jgi:hypothetical protein
MHPAGSFDTEEEAETFVVILAVHLPVCLSWRKYTAAPVVFVGPPVLHNRRNSVKNKKEGHDYKSGVPMSLLTISHLRHLSMSEYEGNLRTNNPRPKAR